MHKSQCVKCRKNRTLCCVHKTDQWSLLVFLQLKTPKFGSKIVQILVHREITTVQVLTDLFFYLLFQIFIYCTYENVQTHFSKLAANHYIKLFSKLYNIIFKDKVHVTLDDKVNGTHGQCNSTWNCLFRDCLFESNRSSSTRVQGQGHFEPHVKVLLEQGHIETRSRPSFLETAKVIPHKRSRLFQRQGKGHFEISSQWLF